MSDRPKSRTAKLHHCLQAAGARAICRELLQVVKSKRAREIIAEFGRIAEAKMIENDGMFLQTAFPKEPEASL